MRDDREDGFGANHSRDDVGCTQRRAGRLPLYIIKGVVDKKRGVYSSIAKVSGHPCNPNPRRASRGDDPR